MSSQTASNAHLMIIVALTREALASTILPVPPDSPTTSARTAHFLPQSPTGPELPMELKIPLPASNTCSEDGADDLESIHCFQSHGSIKAEESLHEGSSYTPGQTANDKGVNQNPKVENADPQDISFDELARLVELERYEGHQSLSIRNSLHQLYLSAGLNRRLSRIASLTYRRMVGSYKASDQAGFIAIHQAYENLSSEFHMAKFGSQAGSWHHGGEDIAAKPWTAPITPWTQGISAAISEDILRFLVNIRTDDGFLSSCISAMSPTELTALTSSYQPVALVGSVLQSHSHVKARAEGYGSRGATLTPGLVALRTFHRNDPYHLLLYGVFDDSAKPHSTEYRLRSDTWSTTCARVLVDGKRGSDEFAITTLDAFAGLQNWVLVPQLEAFLMETLNHGAFLLDPPQPTNFKQPVEIRNAQAVIAGSHFFDKALKTLFQLLADGPLESAVPQTALDFAHATLRKIGDPRVRLKAKTFIVSKWYFQCLLSNILVYPESYGILLEHHVGETARRMILQELAHRMQKVVADVLSPWNHTAIVTPEIQAFVAQILGLFEPPPSEVIAPDLQENSTVHSKNLMLCLDDILCLIEFFYPELSSSVPTTTSDGSAPSTASSVAGSSTLMASSTTPSSSGTSIATHEFIGGDPVALQGKEREVCSPLEKGSSQTPLLEGQYECHRLKDSYNRLKEKPNSEVSIPSGHTANVWAIIHISQDGTKLSMEPDSFSGISPRSRSQAPHKNSSNDIGILTDALTRLMMDRAKFQALAFNLGIDTTNSTENRLTLTRLLDSIGSKRRADFDFTGALYWWRASRVLHELSASEHTNVLDDLLRSISKDLQDSINTHGAATERCSVLCHSLEPLRTFQRRALQTINEKIRVLRVKMWYVSDVRHSAAYEDALHITRALRAMACSSRVKQPGSISTWARHRLRNSHGTDRSESQTLEILTAHKDHGGLSKLADEQVDLTWRWLTRNSIENFCKGEERIHRFCFEIQKCVNKLVGLNLIESPVLWSSRIFEREKSTFNPRPSRSTNHEQVRKSANDDSTARSGERVIYPKGPQASWGPSTVPSSVLPNFDMSCTDEAWGFPRSSAAANFTDIGYQSRSKYSSGITPMPYSLQTYQATVPPRSSPEYSTLPEELLSAKMDLTQHIKKILGSLIISDLGYLLWVHGTETDAWVNQHASREVPSISAHNPKESKPNMNANIPSPRNLPDAYKPPNISSYARHDSILENPASKISADSSSSFSTETSQPVTSLAEFPYRDVYKILLDRFSHTLDPYNKLGILSQLHCLVSSSLDEQSSTQVKGGITESRIKKVAAEPTPISNRAISVPRTKATSLEEVIANCNERRISTLRIMPMTENLVRNPQCGATSPATSTTDSIVLALRDIFRDPILRPTTLFRDLQFIAAFVPSSILDHTSQGTAFWDTGLAALALKDELCASLVTRATEITTYHINGLPSSSPIPAYLATTSLRDAANLWLLAAKEGSPVAARELGLFYLTHPQLLPLVTFPFSRARDVFRTTLTNERGVGGNSGRGGNFGGGAGGGLGTSTGGQPAGLDPWTFAMVFHWMEVAANGGDRDASEFLRGNGELSGVR